MLGTLRSLEKEGEARVGRGRVSRGKGERDRARGGLSETINFYCACVCLYGLFFPHFVCVSRLFSYMVKEIRKRQEQMRKSSEHTTHKKSVQRGVDAPLLKPCQTREEIHTKEGKLL